PSVAYGNQLCGELPVHRHYLDKPPLPYAVRRSSDAGIDMDQLPLATAWIARTQLASSPVVSYAGMFVCIDIAYNVFEHGLLARADATQLSARTRRNARRRSLVVLASFTTAMLVTATQLARLSDIFPGGVCDYSRPGVDQRDLEATWFGYPRPGISERLL